jgi:2-polyprenyl-6-methoxyphenol hydroxylase-like FAD-dependent oxidoreductase
MHVQIVGAGIGGLSAALSLHAAGISASVIDAAAVLRPLGVGINLQPHAVRELTELGLGDSLAATGIQTAEMAHFDRHGNRSHGAMSRTSPRGTVWVAGRRRSPVLPASVSGACLCQQRGWQEARKGALFSGYP